MGAASPADVVMGGGFSCGAAGRCGAMRCYAVRCGAVQDEKAWAHTFSLITRAAGQSAARSGAS
jgi:hypothetical protein